MRSTSYRNKLTFRRNLDRQLKVKVKWSYNDAQGFFGDFLKIPARLFELKNSSTKIQQILKNLYGRVPYHISSNKDGSMDLIFNFNKQTEADQFRATSIRKRTA